MESELGPLKFGIVGAGALGTSVVRGLQAAGHDVVGVASRSEQSRSAAVSTLGVLAFSSAADLAPHTDAVVLCVPDDQANIVVDQLIEHIEEVDDRRLIVTSGVIDDARLRAARRNGWTTVVVQPLTTVRSSSASGQSPLFGAPAMVSASSHAARTLGLGFAHALEMVPIEVDSEHRQTVASMAALAANLPLAILSFIDELGAMAQIPEPVTRSAFARLAHMAIDRWRKHGAGTALGGPIARGDQYGVQRHLEVLEEHLPAAAAAYRELGSTLVQIAHSSGAVTVDQAATLSQVLVRPPSRPMTDT